MGSFSVEGLEPLTFVVEADKLRRKRPAKVGKTPIPGSDLVVRDHQGRGEETLTLGIQVGKVEDYDYLQTTLLDRVGTLVVEDYSSWNNASLEDVSLDSVDPCLLHMVTLTFSV
jgi:hypothetical protein